MRSAAEMAAAGSPLWCRAPFVTLEFDPFGDVQACCANSLYPLGNVGSASIDQIWRGPRAAQLRAALRAGDLSLGCTVCRHRVEDGGAERPWEAYAGFPLPDSEPGWPHRLSFSLHNTCNLECVMCGADRSSKIRSRRSHLPPLPHVYGDEFFEQLGPYLDHCELVDFVGGEPFLIREHWRVWDLLDERGLRPRNAVTTNATVWNERVERVLDRFDTDLRISIDGTSTRTFEQIRAGASHAEVLANLDRFRAYARERGTHLAINWSFVRHNWFELGEMVRWAEDEGIPLNVMTVIEPEHGVQRMPDDELAVVARALAAQTDELLPRLTLNREVWLRQVAMVEAELGRRRVGAEAEPYLQEATAEQLAAVVQHLAAPGRLADLDELDEVRAGAQAEVDRWTLDHRYPGELGVRIATVPVGSAGEVESLLDDLRAELGGAVRLIEEQVDDGQAAAMLWFGPADRDKTGTVVHLRAHRGADGTEVLVVLDRWFAGADDGPVPVTISRAPGAS